MIQKQPGCCMISTYRNKKFKKNDVTSSLLGDDIGREKKRENMGTIYELIGFYYFLQYSARDFIKTVDKVGDFIRKLAIR